MRLRVVLVPGQARIPRRYLVSAIVHVALLLGWAWAPARTKRFEFEGSAMQATLVAAPPSGGGSVRPPAPSPEPPAPEPVAPPPEPKGPSLQPEPKPEEPKKPKDKKKEERKPAADARPSPGVPGTSSETPAGSATPGTQGGGPGGPGTTLSLGAGLPGSDFYNATVRAAIEAKWRRPVLDQDTPSEVAIGFEVLRDGTVRDVQVVRTSGIAALDRSAMRAVIEAAPLPPFPTGWPGASRSGTMIFILHPE